MSMLGPFKAGGPAAAILPGASGQIFGGGESCLIVNLASVPVQVDFSTASFAANATSPIVIPAGGKFLAFVGASGGGTGFQALPLFAAVFAIGSSTGGACYFSRGDGSSI